MPSRPTKADVSDDAILWRFAGQSTFGHSLVVLGGLVVWFGVYVLWLDGVAGNLHFAVNEGVNSILVRQNAVRAASTACWIWYSLAFMVGRGGPFLNTIVYPTLTFVVGPWVAAFALFGRTPSDVVSTGSLSDPAFVTDALSLFLPGMILSLLLIGAFLGLLFFVTGTGSDWEAKHMPDAWHDIEHEDPERSEP